MWYTKEYVFEGALGTYKQNEVAIWGWGVIIKLQYPSLFPDTLLDAGP